MKRISGILLVCALALFTAETAAAAAARQSGGGTAAPAAGFNATGFPIVSQPVTKRFMLRRPPHISDPNDMITFQRYEEMSGVDVEWEVVQADGFNERVNLVMASNTMPDAIIKGTPDITRTSADGSIIDLTPLIEKYSTGIKELYRQFPAVKQASMLPDGKIYGLPLMNTQDHRPGHRNLWINKLWLDKLGLAAPKTLDEFLAVLRAFRDRDVGVDPARKIPYVVEYSGGNRSPRIGAFYNSWGIASNLGYDFITIKDDRVSFFAVSNEYREILQFVNTMWKEKLLDNAVYTQTTDVALSKFNSSISGCFGLSSDDLWSKYANDYIPLPPPQNGNITPVIGLSPVHVGNGFVITRADRTPEITLRWVDYFYTGEGAGFIGGLSPLLEGVTCKKLPDGTYDYTDAILNSPKGVSIAVGEMCPLPGGFFPYWRNDYNSNFAYSAKVKEAVTVYRPYYQKTPAYSYPSFSVETAERVNDIRRDLDVYLAESQAKFITGELGFDRWNEYVAACERMHSKELESIFQTAYERMK